MVTYGSDARKVYAHCYVDDKNVGGMLPWKDIAAWIRHREEAYRAAASTEAGKFIQYPANLAGVPDALIFFCFLFFHQGKKRETIKGREEEPSRKGREISEKRP